MLCTFYLVFILSTCFYTINSDKVPSTDDIDDYNDPVLREVFASSRRSQPGVDQLPQQPRPVDRNFMGQERRGGSYSAQGQQVPQTPVTNNYTPAAVQQPVYTPYSPQNQPPSLSQNGYNSQSGDFGSLAAQGTQTFLQGAQQVGRVFGIDNSAYSTGGGSNAYEFPLSGGFFGRR